MKVVLELQDQLANVRRITVRHDIVIGRGSDCNLRLSSPQVSRRHCFLRVGRDGVSITDLDSSNGTYLNGQRIPSGRRAEVTDGARLALGPVQFLVSIRSEVVTAELSNISALDHSVSGNISGEDRRGATSIPSSSGLSSNVILRPPAEPVSPMNYSIEQGGEAAGENDPTTGPEEHRRAASSGDRLYPGRSDLQVEMIDDVNMPLMKELEVIEVIDSKGNVANAASGAAADAPSELNVANSDEIQIVDHELIFEEEFDEEPPLELTAEDILDAEEVAVDRDDQPAADVSHEVTDLQPSEIAGDDPDKDQADSTWFTEMDSPGTLDLDLPDNNLPDNNNPEQFRSR